MHKSAHEIGHKFLERYWNSSMESILEIGSLDVNGSLKDFQPDGSKWTGVDLEAGKGVDIVIGRASRLPFDDKTFDLIVATSIFEHDPTFWLTFSEMLRVVKDGGYIYVCAPSNGWVHRYPMDVYRFYPDAGNALVEWGSTSRDGLRLIESFISEQDGDIWNDFCAIFGIQAAVPKTEIYIDTKCTNVWADGKFLEKTLKEAPQDMRTIEQLLKVNNELTDLPDRLKAEILQLNQQLDEVKEVYEESLSALNEKLHILLTSKSWKVTEPMRRVRHMLGTVLRQVKRE